jgi:hypothetical protein
VLAAIDLDDQSRLVAHEIGYEAPDRHLTAKPKPFDLARPQRPPEPLLGFRGAAPWRAGVR